MQSQYYIKERKKRSEGMRKVKTKTVVINNKVYFLQEKTQLGKYKEMCYLVYKNRGLEGLFDYLDCLLKLLFPETDPPYNKEDLGTERDLLDVTIEQYTLLYFVVKEKPEQYKEEEKIVDEMMKDKVWNLLMEYKLEKYGKEIMEGLGLELVKKVEQGYIVRDKDDTGNIQ